MGIFFFFFKKILIFYRGEGGVIITPPHLGRETHRGEKFFVLKKSKKFHWRRFVSFRFEYSSLFYFFPKAALCRRLNIALVT
jgi:hypothetical protein